MFGCFRRLGCLVILLVLGVFAWFNRDRLEAVYRRYAGGPPPADTSTIVRIPEGWESVSPDKATRGRAAVQALARPQGPGYATLTAGEAASYILTEVARQLPAAREEITSSIIDDKLYVRASVSLKDFGGAKALGPLGTFLGDRDTVQLGGSIRVITPGTGEFQVRDVKVGTFPVPKAVIPRLIRAMRKGKMPPGISDDGLPMTLPPQIADVRIADGRVTVYKVTQ